MEIKKGKKKGLYLVRFTVPTLYFLFPIDSLGELPRRCNLMSD